MKSEKPKRNVMPWVIGILVLSGALGSMIQAQNPYPVRPPDDQIYAVLVYDCQKAIKQQLKAPLGSHFADVTDPESHFAHVKNRWIVASAVDSQNSFGAMLHMRYGCVFEEGPNLTMTLLKANPL